MTSDTCNFISFMRLKGTLVTFFCCFNYKNSCFSPFDNLLLFRDCYRHNYPWIGRYNQQIISFS